MTKQSRSSRDASNHRCFLKALKCFHFAYRVGKEEFYQPVFHQYGLGETEK